MNKLLKKIWKNVFFKYIFPLYYKIKSKNNIVNNRVLFVEVRYLRLTDNFMLLYKELNNRNQFEVKCCYLGNSYISFTKYLRQCFKMLKELAVSEYVFLNEGSNVVSCVKLRKETKVIQTWHGCGAFKKFGYDQKNVPQEGYYDNYTFVTVSSPKVIEIYASAMHISKDKIKPLGVSRTDIFFDGEFIDNSLKKFKSIYKDLSGKKVILFAPTFRGNAGRALESELPDLEMLKNYLKDEWIFLYKAHPAIKTLKEVDLKYKNFFKNVSNDFSIEELICISDICVTDYSSIVFEYSLFEKPIIFYAYDYDTYVDERGFYYNYEEFVPGKICKNTRDLIDGIENLCENDFEKIKKFKNQFMSSCDGNVTKRIIEHMINC